MLMTEYVWLWSDNTLLLGTLLEAEVQFCYFLTVGVEKASIN